jgi:hypothetical protein
MEAQIAPPSGDSPAKVPCTSPICLCTSSSWPKQTRFDFPRSKPLSEECDVQQMALDLPALQCASKTAQATSLCEKCVNRHR